MPADWRLPLAAEPLELPARCPVFSRCITVSARLTAALSRACPLHRRRCCRRRHHGSLSLHAWTNPTARPWSRPFHPALAALLTLTELLAWHARQRLLRRRRALGWAGRRQAGRVAGWRARRPACGGGPRWRPPRLSMPARCADPHMRFMHRLATHDRLTWNALLAEQAGRTGWRFVMQLGWSSGGCGGVPLSGGLRWPVDRADRGLVCGQRSGMTGGCGAV